MLTQQDEPHGDCWKSLRGYKPLQDLLSLLGKVELSQKGFEQFGNGLDGPALNETRNATYHLIRALLTDDGDKRDDQFGKAIRHAQRAIYDCHEAMLLTMLDKVRKFKDDYAMIQIAPVIPDWLDLLRQAREAQSCIDEAKKEVSLGGDKEKYYLDIQTHVDALRGISERCDDAREELNKIVSRRHYEIVVAISTLVVATLALFL